jgi:hypothetical protein
VRILEMVVHQFVGDRFDARRNYLAPANLDRIVSISCSIFDLPDAVRHPNTARF